MAKPRCSHLLASGPGDMTRGGSVRQITVHKKPVAPFPAGAASITPKCPEALIQGCETSKKAKQARHFRRRRPAKSAPLPRPGWPPTALYLDREKRPLRP